MDRWQQTVARGAAAGTAATLAMTGVMSAAKRAGLLGEHPPKTMVARVLSRAGLGRPSRGGETAIAAAAHLAIGAGNGVVFSFLRRVVPLPLPAVVEGAAYGMLVWAGAYKLSLPWLGLMPRPERDRPGQPSAMIVAHLVYGAALGEIDAAGSARREAAR